MVLFEQEPSQNTRNQTADRPVDEREVKDAPSSTPWHYFSDVGGSEGQDDADADPVEEPGH